MGHMSDFPANQHVVIHGVGLIGGSIGAAVRQRQPKWRVTGIGRRSDRLAAAQKQGLLDDWATSFTGTDIAQQSVIVICLPVGLIAQAVTAAAQSTNDSVLITDAGSVKKTIQEIVERDVTAARRFVGAHPIAGSEHSGFEFADPNLFQNRPCIVTPSPAGNEQVQRCRLFWEALGADVTVLSPDEHDRILALTSHLPHVLACAAAACVAPADLPWTGTGFLDTTRVAAGDPVMWRQILCHNRQHVEEAIERAGQLLAQMSAALAEDHAEHVEEFLRQAAELRRRIT